MRSTAPTQRSSRKTIRRLSLGAAALACAAGLSIAPASAAPSAPTGTQATGTFFYTNLGTPQQLHNPVNGICYPIPAGGSPNNQTNARAVVYVGPSCALFGNPIEPGDTGNSVLFLSVRFEPV
jgi:hypothetical protein